MTPTKNRLIITNRNLTVIIFALFFSWLLSFPFEGRILYALTDKYNISTQTYLLTTIVAHFIGLLTCGFFIRRIQSAKKLILFSIMYCILISIVFFQPPSILWTGALITSSFLVGACVAAWGFYLLCIPRCNRLKIIADGLIYSNLLMILINMITTYTSPYIGLGTSMLMLVLAFMLSFKLPKKESTEGSASIEENRGQSKHFGILMFLCLFVIVITINSGLMFQVIGPAFDHLEGLTSWYWAVPYIATIFIMRNLPRKANRAYILYVAIAMIGFSFITFLLLGRSWIDYIVVNTLMMGACGIYDLFWWSILGEMLELNQNPAKILGVGLSANVLGVLLGGLLSQFIMLGGEHYNPTLLALSVVCVTMVMLPPLHKRLNHLLKDHAYLSKVTETLLEEDNERKYEQAILTKLTVREREIFPLLMKGHTYRMIAGELHVSENTVKTHVKNIYSKVEVKSRTELMSILLGTQDSLSSSGTND